MAVFLLQVAVTEMPREGVLNFRYKPVYAGIFEIRVVERDAFAWMIEGCRPLHLIRIGSVFTSLALANLPE